MEDYSQKEKEKFEKLHQEVLRIKRNLEFGFYLRKSLAQRDRIVREDAKYIGKYCKEVPLDVREDYPEEEKINIAKLTEELYEVKSK